MQQTFAIIGGIALCLLIPALVVPAVFGSRMVFDPSEFVNDYWKFIASIAQISAGFVLLNIYWQRRTQSGRVHALLNVLQFHLSGLGNSLWHLGELATAKYPSESEALARDSELARWHTILRARRDSIVELLAQLAQQGDDTLTRHALAFNADIASDLQLLCEETPQHLLQQHLVELISKLGKAVERCRLDSTLEEVSQ